MSNLLISTDASYALDYYAILLIKNQNKLIRYSVVEDCRNLLVSQIGREKMKSIESSVEFLNLLDQNKKTFNLVEKARKEDNGLAHEVDSANQYRYFAKVKLQKKFFDSEMSIEKKS